MAYLEVNKKSDEIPDVYFPTEWNLNISNIFLGIPKIVCLDVYQ